MPVINMSSPSREVLTMQTQVKSHLRKGNDVSSASCDTTSRSMEVNMIELALLDLHKCGVLRLIKGIVIDQDSSAEKCIRRVYAQLGLPVPDIYTDPGHAKKSLEKALSKIFKTSKMYAGLAGRIARCDNSKPNSKYVCSIYFVIVCYLFCDCLSFAVDILCNRELYLQNSAQQRVYNVL